MEISHITLLFFVMFSALRIISYLPQIYRVAADENGASAISYSTWALWVAANVSTALYAGINLRDPYLAFVSVIYATCCVTVIVLTAIKRRSHRGVDPPRETSRATAMPSRHCISGRGENAGTVKGGDGTTRRCLISSGQHE